MITVIENKFINALNFICLVLRFIHIYDDENKIT